MFLGLMCILGATVEATARLAVPRISRIEAREVDEYRAAIAPRHEGRRTVLILGNSLLGASVQLDRLREGMGASYDVRRWVVDGTFYSDWYFGLRRLLADGARPDVVVVMLSATQLVSGGFRGDYFAHRMMLASDLPQVASDLHLHPTTAAGMLAARASAFYGLRSELRKVLLGRLMPDLPNLLKDLAFKPAPPVSAGELLLTGSGRLQALNAVASASGSRLVFVLVPVPGSRLEYAAPLKKAAADAGVTMILPLNNGELGPADFRDGFHMNEAGSSKYTQALLTELRGVAER